MASQSAHESSHSVNSHDSTRNRLIEAISVDGPISAGDLAERFGLTGAAVRRHLSQLHAEGVIEERDAPVKTRGRGRPRREFVLASTSTGRHASECEDLTLLAMQHLAAAGGDEALHALAESRSAEWERNIEAMVSEREARGDRVDQAQRTALVVEFLRDRGYAASLRPVTVELPASSGTDSAFGRTVTAVQLCQGRCPVEEIASEHPELCEAETASLSRMIGVPVQRLATRAAGAHACTTHLTPALGHALIAAYGDDLDTENVPTHDLLTEGRKP